MTIIIGYLFILWAWIVLSHWMFGPSHVIEAWSKFSVSMLTRAIWEDLKALGFLIAGAGLILQKKMGRVLGIALLAAGIIELIAEVAQAFITHYKTEESILFLPVMAFSAAILVILIKSKEASKKRQTPPLVAAVDRKVLIILRIIAAVAFIIAVEYGIGYLDSTRRLLALGNKAYAEQNYIPGAIFNVLCPFLAGVGLWFSKKWGHILAIFSVFSQALLAFGMLFWGGELKAVPTLLIALGIGAFLLSPAARNACGMRSGQ